MNNVKVLIYIESRYKANRRRIKKTIQNILDENNVTSQVEVSVAIVGDRKMRFLNKKYRNLDKTTNVLSFPQSEAFNRHPEFISGSNLPQTKLPNSDFFGQIKVQHDNLVGGAVRLGDIVLSYPQVINDSARDEMLVDDKIDFLIEHSMKHLLGIHHE